MRNLCEIFKHYRGQPIEVITEHMKFCGIDVESDENGVTLIDRKGRLVRIENRQIEAVIEPQMRLRRLCGKDDCDCDCEREHEHEHERGEECGCDFD